MTDTELAEAIAVKVSALYRKRDAVLHEVEVARRMLEERIRRADEYTERAAAFTATAQALDPTTTVEQP